ncbi:hypothetical protein [Persephonella sp.]
MVKKIIFGLLLIGALFYTFHDYVYYAIDSHKTVVHQDNCSKNDTCKFHENLHIPGMTPISQVSFIIDFQDEYRFSYTKPQLNSFIKEIFKPPKQSA